MLKRIFKRKTEKEKEVSKLENQLHKYQQKRNFFSPSVQKRLLRGDEVESISVYHERKITEYDEKIISIKLKLEDLKGDKK